MDPGAGRGPAGPVRIVLNPVAGRTPRYPCVADDLADLDGATLVRSRAPGHAAELAREAGRDGCATVVAGGGDGTVQEVVQGLIASGALDRVRLGLVPLGTGNDLARSLGVPDDPHDAVTLLRRAPSTRMDLVEATAAGATSTVVNFALGGFAGDIARHVTPERRRLWGGLVYLRGAVAGLGGLRSYRVRLTLDGDRLPPLRLLALVVANGRDLGHGIPVAPAARIDDGRLDVVAVRADRPARVPLTVARLLAGRHLGKPGVLWRRAERVEVASDPPMPYNADGQPLGTGPASFRVRTRSLRVVAPGSD